MLCSFARQVATSRTVPDCGVQHVALNMRRSKCGGALDDVVSQLPENKLDSWRIK